MWLSQLRSASAREHDTHSPSWLWLVPFLLILFGATLRVINRYGFSPDELSSLEAAGGAFSVNSIFRAWTYLPTFDAVHVPGYFMLLNVWGNGVGWSVFATRAFSLLTGLLALAMTYRLAYDVSGRSRVAALTAALTLGISGDFAFQLRYARMYPQLVLLTAFTLWLYHRLMARRREPGVAAYLGLLAGAAGLIYTQYFGLVPLIVIGVTHLTYLRRITARWWRVIGVMALAGLLFLPWVNVMLGIVTLTQNGLRGGAPFSPAQLLTLPLYFFSDGMPLLLALVALLALCARGWRTALLWTVSAFAASIALNLLLRALSALRYTLFLWPILALLAGLGAASAARIHRLLAAALIAVWLVGALWFNFQGYAASAISFAETSNSFHLLEPALAGQFQPDDQLAFSVRTMPYDKLMQLYLEGLPLTTPPAYLTPGMRAFTTLRSDLDQTARLWLAYAPGESPADLGLAAALDPAFAVCKTEDAAGIGVLTLQLLTRAPICCESAGGSQAALAHFGEDIALVHAQPLALTATGALPVLLRWSVGDNVPLHTYSVSLQALDGQGNKIAQTDYELWIGTQCYYRALTLAAGAPGEDRLDVIVYDWKTGERLAAMNPANGLTSDSFSLGQFASAS